MYMFSCIKGITNNGSSCGGLLTECKQFYDLLYHHIIVKTNQMRHATQGGHAGGISMDKEMSIFYLQCEMESNGLNSGKKENNQRILGITIIAVVLMIFTMTQTIEVMILKIRLSMCSCMTILHHWMQLVNHGTSGCLAMYNKLQW